MANEHAIAHTMRTEPVCTVRAAKKDDFESVFSLFQHTLQEGKTYSYSPEEMTPERSLNYWMEATGTHCFVAESKGLFAGCYALRPNRTGRANHVVNASFMVHPDHRGQGIGHALGKHALLQAKHLGYQAIQYNFVVSANENAVKLWKSLDFNVVGVLPKGFQHATLGLVDVFIMHRYL